MSKNTARHIFTTRRMDLSDASLKALEAQVLSYSRDEVGHALILEEFSRRITTDELLQIITPGQGWPRRFEVPCIISCLCCIVDMLQSNLSACEQCAGPVSLPRLHRGVKGSQLLTRDNLFDVTVLVQECTSCNILYQVWVNPITYMFNASIPPFYLHT